jgi:phage terminase large subunit-like protein
MGLRGPGASPIASAEQDNSGDLFLFERKPEKPALKIKIHGRTRADRVISFIECLPVTSGILAGTKFRLAPWQRRIIKSIYHTGRNGGRVVRQALISVPRKNGKSTLTAALALCHLCGPEAERRGEIYSAATEREQAAIVFREMKAMIQGTELAGRVIVRDFAKSLEDSKTGSIYRALSADVETKHGFSSSFWVYDELAQAANRKLYDVLDTSGGGREEPLGIVISTQSPDPHSIMSELTDYAKSILDSTHTDPTFHGTIFSAPMDSDPWAEDTWRACNPGIESGFRSIEEMRAAALKAKRIPAREAVFRLLYLNQPVAADERFISLSDWQACGADIDPERLRGRPCWGGLDLSSTQDLTALVLYFPEDGGAVLPLFWVPRDRLEEREHTDRVPYATWHKQGLIEAPAGRAIDRVAIIHRLGELAGLYDIRGIAYDRWRLEDLEKLIADEGVELKVTGWGQGFKDMGPAVDLLETAILNGELIHPNHAVLTWNVSNAVVEMDPAGARKVSKSRSREKVDGLVALIMAMGIHAREPKAREYDFSGPLVITA